MLSPVETALLFAMRLFKKLSQNGDVNGIKEKEVKKSSFFSWFVKSTAGDEKKNGHSLTLSELVPSAKISASRQASSNIQLTLHGESSQSSECARDDDEVGRISNRECENKFCCGVMSKNHSLQENADKNDESIKSFYCKNFTPNNDQHETLSRRSSRLYEDRKNFFICYEPAMDYGRLEVPDSIFPSIMNWPSINYANVVETNEKKPPTNYELLSNIEHNLDESKYNILNCMLFNHNYQHEHQSLGSGCRPAWKIEDFDDDNNNTPMNRDTKTIKEFYRLSELDDILLHYNDIAIEASHTVGRMKDGFFGFMSWLAFKSKEIKEKHKIAHKPSWLRNFSSRLFGNSEY